MQILKQLLSKEGREKYRLAEVEASRIRQASLATRFEEVFGVDVDVPSIWFNAWKQFGVYAIALSFDEVPGRS